MIRCIRERATRVPDGPMLPKPLTIREHRGSGRFGYAPDENQANDNVCPNCSELYGGAVFFDIEWSKTHEVRRRAKNRPYILSKMDCYKRRELTPVQQIRFGARGPKAHLKAFYISGIASFLLEYSGILPTVLHEKGVTDGPTGKAFWVCAQVRI